MFKKLTITAFFCVTVFALNAQTTSDSARVVKVFKELLDICKYVDFSDPKTQEIGTFYKAAPYIVYRGDDTKRNWKDTANYSNELEKKGVNEVCYRINNTVNQDTAYQIVKYHTETESEGTWYVLQIKYLRKGVEKQAAFAFLKIKGRFALGDIDNVK